jgi:hypothetical protein
MDDEQIGLHCPACGQQPGMLFGGGTQAFCWTDDCPVLTWDPSKSRAYFFANASEVTLTHNAQAEDH